MGVCFKQLPKTAKMDLVWAKLEYTTGDSSVFDSKSAHVKGNNVQTLFVHRVCFASFNSNHAFQRSWVISEFNIYFGYIRTVSNRYVAWNLLKLSV